MIIPDYVLSTLPSGDYLTVCEMGNKRNRSGVYRTQWESMGKRYVSIDLNGKDGALPLDFRSPIDVEGIGGPFDLLTNFGCSEHVTRQEPCWANMHNLINTGGWLSFTMPQPHNWLSHGSAYWYPTERFYTLFSELNGYTVEKLDEFTVSQGKAIFFGRLKKAEHLEFVWNDDLQAELWMKRKPPNG